MRALSRPLGARSSQSIAGLASTPCTSTESPMVNAIVAQSHSRSENFACPAAYAR